MRINRYIMECKFFHLCNLVFRRQELIDTLWNVNLHYRDRKSYSNRELIDTLWNVNKLIFYI